MPCCRKKLFRPAQRESITQAQTTAVLGDGNKVNGLSYKDRSSDAQHSIELEGIFVQIGLLPNTDWLKGTLALSPRGEIEVDARVARPRCRGVCRRRRDHRAIQADHHRHGRRCQNGGAERVRLPDSQLKQTGRIGGLCRFSLINLMAVRPPALSILLGSHLRNRNDIANRRRIGQQHHKTVDADAFTCGWRQAVFQCADVVGVVVHGFIVAGFFLLYLLHEACGLVFGIVQLGEAVGDFAADDE